MERSTEQAHPDALTDKVGADAGQRTVTGGGGGEGGEGGGGFGGQCSVHMLWPLELL